MSLPIIHISSVKEQIAVSRDKVFEFMTDFGGQTDASQAHSTILSRDGEKLLVEFNTTVPMLFGLHRTFKTVEEVILHKPGSLEFREIHGPLAMRQERIVLSQEAGVTKIQYDAEFKVKGWIFGWLLGVVLIRPKLKRAVKAHLKQIKTALETTSNDPQA